MSTVEPVLGYPFNPELNDLVIRFVQLEGAKQKYPDSALTAPMHEDEIRENLLNEMFAVSRAITTLASNMKDN
jgi:hypothetical protein